MSTRKARLDYLLLAARKLRDYEHRKDTGKIEKSNQPRVIVDREIITFLRCLRKVLNSRAGWKIRYKNIIKALESES